MGALFSLGWSFAWSLVLAWLLETTIGFRVIKEQDGGHGEDEGEEHGGVEGGYKSVHVAEKRFEEGEGENESSVVGHEHRQQQHNEGDEGDGKHDEERGGGDSHGGHRRVAGRYVTGKHLEVVEEGGDGDGHNEQGEHDDEGGHSDRLDRLGGGKTWRV